MPLTPGTRLGHYEIVAPLGAGGMGEVYRARDTRLGREVALKVLPEAFAADPDRLARFEREARVLASLNHANIAAIYGLEPLGQTGALVMELVEGPTLEDRLGRGPLGAEEALRFARQIAEALEYAHDRSVVHRDLKPANIKVRDEGTVKVLDFGLAKAIEGESAGGAADLSESPTLTMRMTQAGVILGTAAYMSPEQAGGRPVDRRADIWAFGVILFELLSGQRLFEGETATETLASVIKDPIPWQRLPQSVPAAARRLLERCLMRDARQRLQAIGEARIALDDLLGGGSASVLSAAPPAATVPPAEHGRRLSWLPIAGWLVAIALAILLPLLLRNRQSTPDGAPTYLSIMLPPGDRLTAGTEGGLLAISPDGRTLAVSVRRTGTSQLHLRHLGETEVVPIEGAVDARDPFFSPDGEWLAYFSGTHLYKVSVRGGKPTTICSVGTDRGGTWLEDGTIILAPAFTTALTQVAETGGVPRTFTVLDSTRGERTHRWPEGLPGSDWVLFTCGTNDSPGDYDDATVEAVSRRTGERRVLVRGAMARYSPGGHLVFARGGALHAVPLDPRDPKPFRNPVPVLRGVGGETTSGAYHFDIAENGTLAYLPSGAESQEGEIIWLGLDGTEEPIGAPVRPYRILSLSPDRRRILACAGPGGGAQNDLLLIDAQSGASSRLPVEFAADIPLWLPDGRRYVISSGLAGGIVAVVSLGSDRFDRVLAQSPLPLFITACTPDGRAVLFGEYGQAESDVLRVPVDGDTSQVEIVAGGAGNQFYARVSPDSRWIAFQSNDTGRAEIFVQPYARPGQRVQLTNSGGQWSTWSPDGRTLYYVESGVMMAAGVRPTGDSFATEKPRRLFDVPYTGSSEVPVRSFDMDATGSRFLTTRLRGTVAERREVVVGLGWTASLRLELRAEQ
jgi:serine/threonine-protein kinase